jgi:hypothetical protein
MKTEFVCVHYPLAEEALSDAKAVLAEKGSCLEGAALDAISALLRTLEDGLHGRLSDNFFLASIDPGIGKTLSGSRFLKAWKDAGFTPQVGVLIAVSRRDEINTYIIQSCLAPEDFAVLTRDEALNALGTARPASAPVLFTTQQMIGSRTKTGRPLASLSEFHFRGEPRVLRIWDETMMPEEPLTVRVDDLGLLASPLRHTAPEFIQAVQQLQQELWGLSAGSEITVPDDITAKAPKKGVSDRTAEIVGCLSCVAGKTVQIADTGHGDRYLVGGSVPLPHDFTPAVILDASGRVRPTYRLWEEHRGDLIRLPVAVNDYRRLDLHLWQRGTGKGTMNRAGVQQEIAEALAKVIEGENDKAEWLIVHYKGYGGIVDELKARVPNSRRINTLTWGRHHGTNAFADVHNVIVIGQLTYRPIDYQALACAASGLPVATVEAEIDLEDLRWGEFQHHLLQALCRASVRRSQNGIAGACRAWVISTPSAQTEQRVRETFPGCRFVNWDPVTPEVSQRVQQAITFMHRRLGEGATEIGKAEMRAHLGMTNANNFKRDVVGLPAFQDALRDAGLRDETRKFVPRQTSAPYVEIEE